jgi:hypothetical protein
MDEEIQSAKDLSEEELPMFHQQCRIDDMI